MPSKKKSSKRQKTGPKPKPIDLDELEKLAALQCTYDDIAGFFDVSVPTIERRVADQTKLAYHGDKLTFAEIMARGKAKARVSMRRRQYEAFMAGDRTMMIWLGKQLLGQKQHVDVDLKVDEAGKMLVGVDTDEI